MASLLRLPDELLCMVVDFCDHIRDLRSLSSTCRHFHDAFNPFLYKRAVDCYPHLLTWACDTSQVSVVRKLLAAGADPNAPCVASAPREKANYSRRVEGLRIVPMPRDLLKGTYNHRKLPRGLTTKRHLVSYNNPVAENDDSDVEYDDTFRVDKDDGITYYRGEFGMTQISWASPIRYPQNLKSWSFIGERYFWFPLHAAARAGSLEITKLLVESGALLEPPSRGFCDCLAYMWGETDSGTERWIPLHTAICCGNDSVALYLVSEGSSIWLNEFHTITAMHQAAEMGHLTILEALHAKNPKLDVNLKEGSQKTPIMYAHGGKRSAETTLWLLEHGADPNASIDVNRVSLLRSVLAHLVRIFENLQDDYDPYTRTTNLGSSDEMVDTLKLLLEVGARLGPSDLSISKMRSIYQRLRHVADNTEDAQVWREILLPGLQEDVRDFLDNMGESLCRLSFKDGKIVIKNRGELGPEDVNSEDEDEDSEVESQDEESELGEDDYDGGNGPVQSDNKT